MGGGTGRSEDDQLALINVSLYFSIDALIVMSQGSQCDQEFLVCYNHA